MQALRLVGLGRLVAAALRRVHVQHDRPRALRGELQRLLELDEVVAVDRAEISQAEGLEELPRRDPSAVEKLPAEEMRETVGAYERPLSFRTTTTLAPEIPMLFSAS